MRNTGERKQVRFVHEYPGHMSPPTIHHQTLTVWELDGVRCVKKMGRTNWIWYELNESSGVPTVYTNVNTGSRIVRKERRS